MKKLNCSLRSSLTEDWMLVACGLSDDRLDREFFSEEENLAKSAKTVIDRKCIGCHSSDYFDPYSDSHSKKEGGLNKHFSDMYEKVEYEDMPPRGSPHLTREEQRILLRYLSRFTY